MAGETIRTLWESFALASIDPAAGPARMRDLEDTFYAGALAAVSEIVQPGAPPGRADGFFDEIREWYSARSWRRRNPARRR